MHGWIDGIASETLPMSVEKVAAPSSDAGRPIAVGVGAVDLGEVVVVLHVRVGAGTRRSIVERRAGRERAGLEAVRRRAGRSSFELVERPRPRHPGALGVRGNDVRRVAAVRDDAVHLVEGPEVLAQQPDRDLGDGERVGRVDAELGRDRRVRLAARVLHAHVRDRADARVEVFDRRRVHHHRRVHAVERAPLEHVGSCRRRPLRPACRCTEQRDAEVVDERREREPGADRARGDDVVTARVTDDRERVVLRADREVQRPLPTRHANAVGRSQMPDVDGQARVGERARGPRARLLLFELQLGMRVDAMAERDERVALAIDRRAGGGLSRPYG